MNKFKNILLTMTATLVIGGCAVTPEPVTHESLVQQRDDDMNRIFANQEPVDGPISLYEAMARALKYNMDNRVKLMEEALSVGELEVMRYDMLPELTLDAGYHWRDNEPGASSEALEGPRKGDESLEASKSIERIYFDNSLVMSWNVLDFGVSYVRSQQQANRVMIMKEKRRKVIQNIIQDVRYAYWRAVSAQEILPEMDDMLQQADDALAYASELEKLRLQTPMTPLRYQRSLLVLIRKLWTMREDLSTAKTELAALINIRPGTHFELADTGTINDSAAKRIETPVEELENLALLQRPELIEENYKKNITTLEVRKAMLSMFPGLEFSLGTHHQENKYLFNDSWNSVGYGITWNLFELISGPARMRTAEAQGDLADMRRMAMNMAVLTQVQLSYQRYHLALRNQKTIKQLDDVQSRITNNIVAGKRADREHALEVLRSETAALLARMRRHTAHAEVQNALGRVYNSVGFDPVPEQNYDTDVDELANNIQTRMEQLPTTL
ncbi:MAG: TolC family protein [Pseudomonadota bacterium]